MIWMKIYNNLGENLLKIIWKEINKTIIWVNKQCYDNYDNIDDQVTEFDWNGNGNADWGDHSVHAEQLENFYRLMFSHEVMWKWSFSWDGDMATLLLVVQHCRDMINDHGEMLSPLSVVFFSFPSKISLSNIVESASVLILISGCGRDPHVASRHHRRDEWGT